MSNVSQPPEVNFSMVVTIRIVRHKTNPIRLTGRCLFHFSSFFRFLMKKRDIPRFESEKVAKTLIEYITTRVETDPLV
jgi:hypothetical protein